MRNYLVLLFFAGLVSSCYYNNEEDLFGIVPCDATNVTYSTTITKIMNDNCVGCHSDASLQGGISLEGYEKVKVFAAPGGALLGTIEHLNNFSPMPKNLPKISDCDISKVRKWVADGAPNN